MAWHGGGWTRERVRRTYLFDLAVAGRQDGVTPVAGTRNTSQPGQAGTRDLTSGDDGLLGI